MDWTVCPVAPEMPDIPGQQDPKVKKARPDHQVILDLKDLDTQAVTVKQVLKVNPADQEHLVLPVTMGHLAREENQVVDYQDFREISDNQDSQETRDQLVRKDHRARKESDIPDPQENRAQKDSDSLVYPDLKERKASRVSLVVRDLQEGKVNLVCPDLTDVMANPVSDNLDQRASPVNLYPLLDHQVIKVNLDDQVRDAKDPREGQDDKEMLENRVVTDQREPPDSQDHPERQEVQDKQDPRDCSVVQHSSTHAIVRVHTSLSALETMEHCGKVTVCSIPKMTVERTYRI
jgi:hypothetical protein